MYSLNRNTGTITCAVVLLCLNGTPTMARGGGGGGGGGGHGGGGGGHCGGGGSGGGHGSGGHAAAGHGGGGHWFGSPSHSIVSTPYSQSGHSTGISSLSNTAGTGSSMDATDHSLLGKFKRLRLLGHLHNFFTGGGHTTP